MPGRAGLGRRQVPALDHRHPGDRRPEVAIRARPDRERQPAAVAQHPPRLRERGGRVGHQHVAEAAEDAVDAGVVEVHALGIEDPELGCSRARGRSPRRRAASTIAGAKSVEISFPSSPIALRRQEAGVAGARRELEHGVAGLRIEPLDQPLAQRAGARPEVVALALPVGREPVPGSRARCWRYSSRSTGRPRARTRLTARIVVRARDVLGRGGLLDLGLLGRRAVAALARRARAAAPTNSRNSGSGRVGRELNSGWNCEAT